MGAMRALIAEDDVTSRTMLQAILTRWGYDLVVVADGLAAWEVLRRADAPRLALLDWMMPGLDGPEVCRRVRAHQTAEPPYLIILTARGDKTDIVAGLEAGADDYIAKPYDSGELRARLGVGSRVVELQDRLRRALADAQRLARTDPLTEVPNRRAILGILEAELARAARGHGVLSVSMLDIDHFKHVNDTLGHAAGDAVLQECVRRIGAAVRPYDIVGRFGGEEFLLVISSRSGEPCAAPFERVRATVADLPFDVGAERIAVTVSQGVACWNGTETGEELIRRADAALYHAKENGRNRVEFAGSSVTG